MDDYNKSYNCIHLCTIGGKMINNIFNFGKVNFFRLLFMIIPLFISSAAFEASAVEFYIDNNMGNDSNSGLNSSSPWKSLSNIDDHSFSSGDKIFLKKGQIWNEDLNLDVSGSAAAPVTVDAYGSGILPEIRGGTISGAYITIKNLIIDRAKTDNDALRLRGANNIILQNLTIKNGLKDGLDVARTVDLLIDSCQIHHFLAGSYTNQVDAHGIAIVKSQNIVIHNTEIHHVSGDSLQADSEREETNLTNNILIEDCHFWTGPLSENFNSGWIKTDDKPDGQKQYPGENAIDTKVLKSGWENYPPMSVTIRRMKAHGWKNDDFIDNKAVFNLKENVEVTLDDITVYDSEIAFRFRGTRGNADVSINNAVISNCEVAVRAEDDLQNLQIFNSDFGTGIGIHILFAGGDGGKDSWTIKNNTFFGSKPEIASDPSNIVTDGTRSDTKVILKWNPNDEGDLAGYNIYFGTSSRDYGLPIPVGKINEYTFKNLEVGKVYYFAVTSFDLSGNESGFSREISLYYKEGEK